MCPAVIQRDCVRWLDEVSTQIPTVVFEAITESGAAQRVTVKQGEQVLALELDGRPLAMNPGYYEFRFELPGEASKLVAVLLRTSNFSMSAKPTGWPVTTLMTSIFRFVTW